MFVAVRKLLNFKVDRGLEAFKVTTKTIPWMQDAGTQL